MAGSEPRTARDRHVLHEVGQLMRALDGMVHQQARGLLMVAS